MSELDGQPGSGTDDRPEQRTRVIYVTPDCTDSAVQKRVAGFLDSGIELSSFSFRRRRYNVNFIPDWPNVELGMTTERRLATRVWVFLRALG